MSFFVLIGTAEKKGPYSPDELMAMLANGEVTEETVLEEVATGSMRSVREVLGGGVTQSPPVHEGVVVAATADKPKSSRGLIVGLVIAAVALCTCIPLMAAMLFFPVFPSAKVAAKRTAVMSQFKQATTAMLVYTADYDDLYPPVMESTDDVKPLLAEYLESDSVWDVSILGSEEIQTNPHLAGMAASSLDYPDRTVLFFYTPAALGDKAIVSFIDGSVKVVDSAPLIDHLFTDNFVLPIDLMKD